MYTVNSQQVLTFINQYTNRPGIGSKKWEEFIPENQELDLNNLTPFMDPIWQEYQGLPADPEMESLFTQLGKLRLRLEPNAENPFLWPDDPSRQHPVFPGPDAPTFPPGIRPLTVKVDGHMAALNPDPSWAIGGAKAFVSLIPLSNVETKTWSVSVGRVEFILKESSSGKGPWNGPFRCHFTLEAGQVSPNLTITPSLGRPKSWWLLKVVAHIPSEFTVPPFAY